MEANSWELRWYMEQTYGGVRPDRSTCSYALEFLKTERANRIGAHIDRDQVGEFMRHLSEASLRPRDPEKA